MKIVNSNQDLKNTKDLISIKKHIYLYLKQHKDIQNRFNVREYVRLLKTVTKMDINEIVSNINSIYLNKEEIARLNNLLNKLYIEYIPLQYLLKFQNFYHEQYYVNKNVLIPRNDSETLVSCAIDYSRKYNFKTLLDMCCGSGCIGISIAKNSNISSCTLVDISKAALNVAERNIKLNKAEDKCKCICSDMYQNLYSNFFKKNDKYDIIVSNPPYIRSDVIKDLSKYVQNEPKIALDGGKKGIDYYQILLSESSNFLNNLGFLIFEIGFDQKDALVSLISKYKEYGYMECIKDLSGNDRVIVCRFHKI